jgi:hypothetical protein
MKKFLTLLLAVCFVCLGASAQKIKKSEYDKFNKTKHIETSWIGLKSDLTGKDYNVSFYSFGGKDFFRIKINKCPTAIAEGTNITILMENDDTYNLKVYEDAIAAPGKGATKLFGAALPGVDIFAVGDLAIFDKGLVAGIRVNTIDGYWDVEVSDKKAKEIQKAYQLFVEELAK